MNMILYSAAVIAWVNTNKTTSRLSIYGSNLVAIFYALTLYTPFYN